MTDLVNEYESIDDVEALVRAAGDFVLASDDLRPRVLETARKQLRERTARRWVRGLGFCVVMLTVFTASDGRRWSDAHSPLASAIVYPTPVKQNATGPDLSGDFDWGMVDGFTKMRRLQAEVFRVTM